MYSAIYINVIVIPLKFISIIKSYLGLKEYIRDTKAYAKQH
jgi:hypothetical protein